MTLVHNSTPAVAAALTARGYRYGPAPRHSMACGMWSRCTHEDADGTRHYVHLSEFASLVAGATEYELAACFARGDGSWVDVRLFALDPAAIPARLDALEAAIARARAALTDMPSDPTPTEATPP